MCNFLSVHYFELFVIRQFCEFDILKITKEQNLRNDYVKPPPSPGNGRRTRSPPPTNGRRTDGDRHATRYRQR